MADSELQRLLGLIVSGMNDLVLAQARTTRQAQRIVAEMKDINKNLEDHNAFVANQPISINESHIGFLTYGTILSAIEGNEEAQEIINDVLGDEEGEEVVAQHHSFSDNESELRNVTVGPDGVLEADIIDDEKTREDIQREAVERDYRKLYSESCDHPLVDGIDGICANCGKKVQDGLK